MSALSNSLAAFFPFNGNATDSSKHGIALSGTYVAGAAKLGTNSASLTVGNTLSYSGNLWDAISYSQSFTVAAWINVQSFVNPGFISIPILGGTNYSYPRMGGSIYLVSSSGTSNFNFAGSFMSTSFSGGAFIQSPSTYSINSWNHVALVNDATIKTAYLYINGAVVGSYQYTGNFTWPGWGDGFNINYPQYISALYDSVGFWYSALSQSDITYLQTNETIPSTTLLTNLQAFYNFENTQNDSSYAGRNLNTSLYPSGASSYIAGKIGTNAISLTGRALNIDEDLWDIYSSPTSYSVAFWFQSKQSDDQFICGAAFSAMGLSVSKTTISGSQKIRVSIPTTSYQDAVLIIGTTTIAQNTWYHICIVHDSVTKTLKLYINGTLEASGSYTSLSFPQEYKRYVGFGINGSAVNSSMTEYAGDAYYDAFGIWNEVLTQAQINTLQTQQYPFGITTATVSLPPTSYYSYDGTRKAPTVTTSPANLKNVSYYIKQSSPWTTTINGPVDAGEYRVYTTLTDSTYGGGSVTTILISPSASLISVNSPTYNYDGTQKTATATTTPAGLAYSITYNGSTTQPKNVGSYALVANVTNTNYTATPANGTLTINAPPPAAKAGGNGGSGVVILTIPSDKYTGITTGNPTVSAVGNNILLTFNSSGTYTA